MRRVTTSRIIWARILIGLQIFSLNTASPWLIAAESSGRLPGIRPFSNGRSSAPTPSIPRPAVPPIGVPAAPAYSALGGSSPTCDPTVPTASIVQENSQPGTSPSLWDVSGAGSDLIQGFATQISVNRCDTVSFKIKTPANPYHLDIYRMGYYGGMGARKVATVLPSATLPQSQPTCVSDPAIGLVDCGNWAQSASWDVPAGAVSGLYFAHAVRDDQAPPNQGDSHIFFVVRDDNSTSDILVQTSDPTWQAYNRYGGYSFYFGSNAAGRAYKLSYNRPFDTRNHDPQSFVFNAEYPMIRFLEANGYNVSYTSGLDTDTSGSRILQHKIFLSSGHDEYWSGGQRASVEAARDAGVNLAFFSGNEIFWKTRWENSIDGSNALNRTLVSYKETWANAKIDPTPTWTGTWRDPRFSTDGGRPENALTGTLFTVDNTYETRAMAVSAVEGKLRFWRNTSAATLPANGILTLPVGTLGYEWDGEPDNGFRPAGLIHLSTATYFVPGDLKDYGSTYSDGTVTHHLTLYRKGNALVFGAGSVQWAWGLDANHDKLDVLPAITVMSSSIASPTVITTQDPHGFSTGAVVEIIGHSGSTPDINLTYPVTVLSPTTFSIPVNVTIGGTGGTATATTHAAMRQATVNLFADMGVQPGSPQPGIITTVLPTDIVAPTSTIVSPTAGASLPIGANVVITGTASDTNGVVAGVEVSVDNGVTWHQATGQASWTYLWTPNALGASVIKSRATDDSGNLETAGAGTSVTIVAATTFNCPCTIWDGSTIPANVDANDAAGPDGVEVGVRFRSEVAGYITGFRFYKAPANTGTHTGHLWTNLGIPMATAVFTSETADGWQQVQLSTPVAIAANTTYVASYHAPFGHYSFNGGYFGSSFDHPPLHALMNGLDGANAAFHYGVAGNFPDSSGGGSNYWVDVEFRQSLSSPPVAGNDSYSVNEDASLAIAAPGVLANDTNPNAGTLFAALVSPTAHGALTLNGNGSFTYAPGDNYFGADSFTYKVNDGTLDSNVATVNITVNPVNDAPSFDPIADQTIAEDPGAQTINITNVSAGPLEVSQSVTLTAASNDPTIVPAPSISATGATRSLTYTPTPNAHGSVVITVTADDGQAANNTFSRTFTITVTSVNDAPVAVNDSYSATEDTLLTVGAPGVLGNDSDIDSPTITAVLVAAPTHGTLTLNPDGSFTYLPAANYNGADSFTYKANDGALNSNVATVSLAIAAVNDPPVANADSYSTNEDTPLTVNAPGVLGNDTDVDGDPLTAIVVALPAHGTLTLVANGSFTYTPAANYNGSDSFTYKANDGALDSSAATVSLTIVAVNDPPVANNDSYSMGDNTTLTVAAPGVLSNDTDVELDALLASIASGTTHGSLSFNVNGSFSYTPAANFTGTDSFTYRASDTAGALSGIATVTITVTHTNVPPVVNAGTNQTITLPATASLSGTASDSDGTIASVLWAKVSGVGTVAFGNANVLATTATFSAAGTYVLSLTATDNSSASSSANVTITVNPVAVNTALKFNGSTNRVTFGPAPGLGATTFTVEGWFKRDGPGTTASSGTGGVVAVPLITKGVAEAEGSNVDMNYFVGIDGMKRVLVADFEDTINGGNHPIFGTTVICDGIWYHVAATYDGTTWRLYLNGVLDATLVVGAFSPRADSIQHAGLGVALNSTGLATGSFFGTMDEVRIWSGARTLAQIQSTMGAALPNPQTQPGLLGRWALDDGAGTVVADSSGHGINGTVVNTGFLWVAGSPFVSTPLPPGQYGLHLTGTPAASDYVTFGAAPGLNAASFTIETWFKKDAGGIPTSTGTGGINAIPLVTKGRADADGNNQDVDYFLGINSTNVIAGDFEEGVSAGGTPGLNHPILGTTQLVVGTWYHAALTYDGTTLRLYLNGVQETSLVVGRPTRSDSIEHAALGTALTSTGVAAGFFAGTLDEARIWNYTRTAAQILNAKEREIATASGLLGRWGFNDGCGSCRDSSGNNQNGTLFGSSWTWVAGQTFASQPNAAPVVTAGADQTINLPPGTAALSGSVTDDNSSGSPLVITWTKTSGPGTVTFSNPNAAVTNATFGTSGTYVLTLTANDGELAASASTTVTVTGIVNVPPTVNAGPDQTITLPTNVVTLAGVATDSDGFPGPLTLLWTKVSGPGTVTFANATAASTTATFSLQGSYVLQLAANDGAATTNSTLTVTVNPSATNKAIQLGGTNAYVTFGAAPGLGASAFTLETWFRRDAAGIATFSGTGGVTAIPLVTKGMAEAEGSNVDMNYFLGIDLTSNKLVADFEDMATGLNHPVSGTTVIPSDGAWRHAAVTYDGTTWRVYLNGVLETTLVVGAFTPRHDSIQHATLGTALNSTGGVGAQTQGFFAGVLDEARIWNYARSTQQIGHGRTLEISSATPGLLARWGLNEGTGTVVGDSSGHAIAGTIVGSNFSWVAGAPFTIPLDTPPTAVSDTATTPEDTAAVIAVLANDTDADGDAVTLIGAGTPAHGTATANANGTVTYTPLANYNGSDTFTYTITDSQGSSATGSVTVTITPVNDAPAAVNDTYVTAEDTPLSVTAPGVLANDTDVDGDTLTAIVVTTPTHGGLSLNSDGSFTYTPNANYNGPDSFTYKANDGTTNSAPATVSLTVTSVNDAPVATADSYTTNEDTPLTVAAPGVLGNDTDVEGDALSAVGVSSTTHGTLTLGAGGSFTYTPNANYNGPDSFTYQANDGTSNSNVVTVSITVTAVNDAPVALDGALTTLEDTPASGTLSASDVDADTLTYSIVTNGLKGIAAITNTTTGAFTYTPNPNANGSDSITFKVNDSTVDSNTATVSITITAVNDAPVASDGTLTTAEDTVATGTLIANDVEGDALTYTIVTSGGKGTAAITNPATGAYTYTPNPNANGTDTITFKARDAALDSNIATVTISITAVNDAPVASDGTLTTLEDTPSSGTLVASDVDGDTLTYAIVTNGSKGTASITNTATGAFTYTPNANANGTDTITFKAHDASVDSNTATLTVTITPVNDAPIASNGTLTTLEDTPATGTLTASDVDGDALTYSIVTNGTKGAAAITNVATGAFTYTPSANANGTDSITFKVNDTTIDSNTATVTITITAVNDAPVAVDGTLATLEDTPASGTLVATDADSDPLTIAIVTNGSKGTATITNAATGAFTYTPNANANGTDTVTFKAHDASVDSNTATLTITITPVNDAPTAANGTLTTLEDTPGTGTLTAADIDGDALTYTIVVNGTKGSATITNAATGAYTYTPNANANGTDSFTFKVHDALVDSNTATMTVTITAVNDAPVAANGTLTTLEDTAASGTLVATDADGEALTYAIVAQGTKGVASITNPATGAYTYTPNPNANGLDSVTFKARDAVIDSNTATITVTITAVNDAPVALDGTLTTTEDTPASGTLVATDADGDAVTYAIVASGSKGTATMTNAATGAYTYTPNANANGTDTITFKAHDAALDSNIATVTITITAVNDAPVASNGTLTTLEDTTGTGTLVATDVDGDTLTYTIVANGTKGSATITNATTGAYTYTPNANANGTDTITFKARDASVDSNTATVTITITAVNDAPVAVNGTLTTLEDTPTTGTFAATDADNDTLTYSIVTNGTKGTAAITNATTGAFTYTPSLNANGTDTVIFKANDGTVNSGPGTVTITITPVNDAPVASNGTLTTPEDTPATGAFAAIDADSDALTYSIVTNGTKGTAAITNATTGAFTYTPNLNANGTDTVTFKAFDGTVDSGLGTVTITITPVNDAPVASNGTLTTLEDTTGNGTLGATDVDLDTLTYSIVANGTKGTATVTDPATGAYTYTPNLHARGTDTITFKARDAAVDSNIATVTITIAAVNHAPVANSDSYSVNEDATLTVAAAGVLTNDTDIDGDGLHALLVSTTTSGTLALNSNGGFTYTPNANYNGPDGFSYKANDSLLDSNVVTVSITVNAVNDAPVASNGTLTTAEDTPAGGTLVATDIDGDTLTFAIVTNGTKGTAAVNTATGAYTYTPNANANGTDSFTFKAHDASVDSNTATITVTITAVNDAPVATNVTLTTLEDTPASGTLAATDADSDPLTYSIVTNGSKGTATITNPATGAFTYTPAANANGTDTITFKARDASVDSNTATLTVTITAVNDAPVASTGTLTTLEDTTATGTLVATDVDGDALTYVIVAQGTKGTATITNAATGAFSYTPNGNANGTDSFTFKAHDASADSNTATVTITITAVNDAPVAQNGTLTTLEDTVATGTFVAADAEGDALTFAIVTNGSKGTATITNAATGAFSYTPNPNANGPDSVTFKANDASAASNTATVSITITAVNDAPIASAGTLTTAEDTPASGTVAATDVDGDTLTYSIVTNGLKGTALITNATTGAYTYTPNANANGLDSFTFNANDGTTNSAPATVSITITAVNDAPVAAAGTLTTLEDTAANGTLVATDADSDPLTYAIVVNGLKGTATITNAATGAYTYTPNANANGTDSFTFKAHDVAVDSNIATVTVTITPVNDAPVASNGTLTTAEDTLATGTLVATDIDGDGLTYAIVVNGLKGTATITNAATGAYTYTPNANANGTDSFTFKTHDVAVDSNTATISVTITAVNDAPVASNGTLTTAEDTLGTGTLVATDADGDAVTYAIVANGLKGTATMTNPATGAYTYTPNANANGPDSFTFKAHDASADSNTATISVTITAVNDAPIASNGTLTTLEDTAATGTLVAADVDGDALTYSIVSNGGKGTATITNATTGAYSYTPNPNANGSDSFTFKANDNTVDSNTATISVTITPVNDAPIAANGVLTTLEDTATNSNLVATDADGDALTYSIVANGAKGTATITNTATGTFTYTPNLNANGADSFTFRANDGTVNSNTATISITITPVNDAPVVDAGSDVTITLPVAASLVGTATDIDSSLTLTWSKVSGPGTVTFGTPNAAATTATFSVGGVYVLSLSANDGQFNVSDTVTVTVNTAANNGLRFDGVSKRVTFGPAPALDTATFTIETWFRKEGAGLTASTGTGGVVAIPLLAKGVAEAEGSNVDGNYFLGILGTTRVLAADFEDSATGLNHPVLGVTPICDNVWYHAAATYDGTTWRLYLNGVLETTLVVGAFTPRFDSIQHAGLAAAFNSTGVATGAFLGTLDEPRVWNFARSAAEIQSTMTGPLASATGLIGRWSLDEGTGTTITDSTGRGNTGTIQNGAVWVAGTPYVSTPLPPGNYGIHFTGTTADAGYVTFGAAPGLDAASFTIETWFKRDSAGVSTTTGNGGVVDAIPLVTKGRAEAEGSNVDMDYFLGISAGTNVLATDFEEGVGGVTLGLNHPLLGTTVIQNNVWYHAAVTYDGTTLRLYLNGVQDASLVVGRPTRSDSIQHAAIGSALTSTGVAAGFFGGTIDEARIWNIARSAAQILAGKDVEIPTASGLLGRWGFNDACGGVLDSSGNGRNGTISGANCTFVAGAPFNNTPNAAPVANAGADQAVTLPALATLTGSYTDDGLSGLPVTTTWTKTSGPGTVSFGNAAAPNTTAGFSAAGTYVLTLTANDGLLSGSDDITITTSGVVNLAPVVNAGSNQTITLPTSVVTLTGSFTDDNIPGLGVTTLWSKVSGPGTVTFGNAAALSTTATFSAQGTYVLQLAANDTLLVGTGTVTITVNPNPASKAIQFGANSYVTFGPALGLGSATFTVETWFRRDGAGVATFSGTGGVTAVPLVTKGMAETEGSNVDMNYFLGISSTTNTLVADFEDMATGLNHPVAGTTAIPADGTWRHAAITYDGTTWRVYLNGVLETTLVVGNFTPRFDSIQHAALATALNSVGIVTSGQTQGSFNGVLDEARIWNYARSAQQISHGRTLEIPSSTPGLLGRWGLNEGSGTVVADSSGRAITGTAVGTITWVSGAPFPGPANTTPVATTDTATTAENSAAIAIAVLTNDTDADSDTLTLASVGVPGHGTASMNPNGTVNYTPAANYYGSDSFTYAISDGQGGNASGTVNVTVTRVNHAPVAVNDSYGVNQDSTLTVGAIGVLTNDTDSDGDTLSASGVSNTSHGTVTLNADGSFIYTPAAGYTGADSFSYKANDGATDSNVATVAITVNAVNHAPVATNDSYSTNEDTVLTVATPGVLGNDTDSDGNPLTAGVVVAPTHGSLTLGSNGSISYTPNANWNGSDSFTYRANDGSLNSNTATVAITVNAVNDAPVASNGTLTTAEDTPATGTLVASDIDGDALTYVLVTNGGKGSVTMTDSATGAYTYTPNANANGSDSFTFNAHDAALNSNTATVSVTITPVNDAPVAFNGTLTTPEDTPANYTLVATDVDGNTLFYSIVSNGTKGTGTITNTATGAFSYTPSPNVNGADSITFKVNDGTVDSNTATLSITITPVNDAPVAGNDSYSATEDTLLTVGAPGVLGNDSDTDSATITAVLVAGPSHGTLTLNPDGSFTYTPAADYNGPDTFTYRANDGALNSNVATVSIAIAGVNDAPVANTDSYSTNEDTVLTVAAPGVLSNDADVDGDTLTAIIVTLPAHGTLTLGSNGSVSYTPSANYNGPDSFTYKARDAALDSNVATVNITVNAVNDAPVAGSDSYSTNEDTTLTIAAPGVLANDTDVDTGDTRTAVLAVGGAPAHGTLTLNLDGSFSYTPALNYNGTDTFQYQAKDAAGALSNAATVTITIAPVNDAPVAVNDSFTVNEDTTVAVVAPGVLGNDSDVDGDAITAVLVTGPIHGSLTLNPNGSLTYTPTTNYNGSDSFTYRANDGAANSNLATVSLTVVPVNDAPVAVNDSYSTNEDTPLTLAAPGVLTNDVDVDGDTLIAILVANPTHGAVTLNPNGSFTYTPNANYNGPDSFTYKAHDGTIDSNVATVTLTVVSVNDAPVATNDSYSTDEDTTLTVTAPGVLGNDSDADGDAMAASVVTNPGHGTLTLGTNGAVTYTPAANYNGPDSFTYRVSDGIANSNIATVSITVIAVNDAPVAVNDSYSVNTNATLTVATPGVLVNDSDIDSASITAVQVSGPTHGTLSLNANGSFVYTPTANYSGPDSFTYRANDGALNSGVATVSITVTGTNVSVPNVVNMTQAAATTSITTIGLVVGTVTNAFSNTVPSGSVISQNPVGGTLAAPGSAVALVVSSGPPALAVDKTVFSDGSGTRTTAAFSTSAPGEVLVAFVGADGPNTGNQTVTVSGAGLTWTLVKRSNNELGVAEIWTATAANQLTSVTVSATQSRTVYQMSLTVVAFTGASGVGASSIADGLSGAPAVPLTTTKAGSLVYGVGNDWDGATSRTLGPGQTIVHQRLAAAQGDTFWVQALSAPVASIGPVQLNDTAPTADQWNYAAVEIVSKR